MLEDLDEVTALKFRVLGFEVDAHASFAIMTLLLSSPRGTEAADFIASASWLLAVSVSVLVHELGHAYAFRAFGGDPRIELYSLGGMTYCTSPRDFTYRQSALISVAGPLDLRSAAWCTRAPAPPSSPTTRSSQTSSATWFG
jgi:hypothetical protein